MTSSAADGPLTDAGAMRLALAEAFRAASEGEIPVGAVLVKDGVVLASGRNAPVALHDPSAHAEIIALRAGAATIGNYRLDGCTLYTTLEPCLMCAGALINARVGKLVFGASDPKAGAAGSVVDVFANPRLNHHAEVVGGVLADECRSVLQTFFQERRNSARAAATPLRDDALRTPVAQFAGLIDSGSASYWVHRLPLLAGWRMHYFDEGPADAALCCLALHGPGEWGWVFRHFIEAVRAHNAVNGTGAGAARLLVPDMIGFGQSDKPKQAAIHTVEWHAAVLAQWLDALAIGAFLAVCTPGARMIADRLRQLAPGICIGLLSIDDVAVDEEGDPRQTTAAPHPAWRAPYPDRGHQAALRALGKGRGDEGPSPARALALLRRAMGYFVA
ncbi:MAG: tRNA adenosine(34) deaminase TadA [Variovorax sp.]